MPTKTDDARHLVQGLIKNLFKKLIFPLQELVVLVN